MQSSEPTRNGKLVAADKTVLVTLIRPRRIRVLVIRQDEPNPTPSQPIYNDRLRGPSITNVRAEGGTGSIVELPLGENDVITALTLTGGLPRAGAVNEILIYRGYCDSRTGRFSSPEKTAGLESAARSGSNGSASVTRIPLRLPPGAQPSFGPEDVVLQSGDIILIKAARCRGVLYRRPAVAR